MINRKKEKRIYWNCHQVKISFAADKISHNLRLNHFETFFNKNENRLCLQSHDIQWIYFIFNLDHGIGIAYRLKQYLK